MNCVKCGIQKDYTVPTSKEYYWPFKNKAWFCDLCRVNFISFIEEKLPQLIHEFIQPERSKREDSVYKYCYVLYDYSQDSITACNTPVDVVFSKEAACSWVDHGHSRTMVELKVCKVFPEMRCSEHCGNTVREAQ